VGKVVSRLEKGASCSFAAELLHRGVVEDLVAGMVIVECVVEAIACMELVAWVLE